jgi:hypothetical protein
MNCFTKVWIHKSRLHLIPLAHVSLKSGERRRQNLSHDSDGESLENGANDEFIATSDALKLIRDPHTDTLAPPAVEKLVWDRISGFVQKLLMNTAFAISHRLQLSFCLERPCAHHKGAHSTRYRESFGKKSTSRSESRRSILYKGCNSAASKLPSL